MSGFRYAVLCILLAFASAQETPSSNATTPPQNSTSESAGTQTPTANSTSAAKAPAESPKLVMIKGPKPVYPLEARDKGIQGEVWVKLTVSPTGDVESVEAISGDPILIEPVIGAVKKWKFEPYVVDGKPVRVSTKLPFDFFFGGKVVDQKKPVDGAPTTNSSNISVSPNGSSKPPLRVRVSASVSQGLLLRQVAPVYPPEARQRHIEGSVVMQALIGTDGRLKDLRVLRGPQELLAAALGAVQQWRYKPYSINGEPVEVETSITVNFILASR